MKRVLAGVLVASMTLVFTPGVFSSGSIAHAEEVYLVPPPPAPMRREWRAQRMKHTGITLSIIGTALIVSGSLVAGAAPTYYDARADHWNEATAIGASMAIPGTVLLVAGLPMWVAGASESRRVERRFSLAPNRHGRDFLTEAETSHEQADERDARR